MIRTERQLKAVGRVLESDIKKELRAQGHVVTRKTLNSVQFQLLKLGKEYELNLSVDTVGTFLEYGRKAGKKPNFDAILKWVKDRGLPRTQSGRTSRSKSLSKLQEQVAGRITNSIAKKGIPSPTSYKYSKNGERLGFVRRATSINKIEQLIDFDEVFADFIGIITI